jgi:hypothetical protein
MDGFDPFENHEGVLGTPKTAVVDPFSWNENFSTEESLGGFDAGLSNGLYPSLVDNGPNANTELSLPQTSTTEVFHQEDQNKEQAVDTEATKVIHEASFPDEHQDTYLSVEDNTGDTIANQVDDSDSSKTGDVDAFPKIVVSDFPDGGLAASKKVNILFFLVYDTEHVCFQASNLQ